MKTIRITITLLTMIAVATGILLYMKNLKTETPIDEVIETTILKKEITVTDGQMTPEVLLALGRLSDPQVSPDGKYILYGVRTAAFATYIYASSTALTIS